MSSWLRQPAKESAVRQPYRSWKELEGVGEGRIKKYGESALGIVKGVDADDEVPND